MNLVQATKMLSYKGDLKTKTGEIIKKAYETPYKDCFTDDASVVEANGGKIHIVEGSRDNIKITTPFDLKIAESILDEREY